MLDPEVVQFSISIPSCWKIRGLTEMDKWQLRQSLADTLLGEIIWRRKSKSSEGSSLGGILPRLAEKTVPDKGFGSYPHLGNGDQIRSNRELWFYHIF